jgi:hypothetical protein
MHGNKELQYFMSWLNHRFISSLFLSSLTLSLACGSIEAPDSELDLAEPTDVVEGAALAESPLATPTDWWWYYGQSPAQVSSLLSANNARLVSLQVETASPLTLTVAMVRNTGSYAKGWWWYHGLTAADLSAHLSANNARLTALEAYDVNGSTRFAAVMIPNTGADAKAWWWYYGATTSQIASALSTNNARLVDFGKYTINGASQHFAVMISNTGADAKAWWWYLGVTGAQVASFLSQNQAFLIDIEPADASGSTFNVVMEQTPAFYWWYYGLTSSQLADVVAQNGARIFNLETYFVGGSRRFAAIMINNSNAETTRVGQILRNGTDGATGLYLQQNNGPVLASLQANRIFEPASTIKIVIGLHAMQQVDAGLASLNDLVSVYQAGSGSCPTNNVIGTETMSNAILQMLEVSDNQRTKALINRFGFGAINATADDIGMGSTNLNHYPGCGGPIANQLTLEDAAALYSGVADASLLSPARRQELYDRMPANAGDFTGIESALDVIVDQEAVQYGLTSSQRAAYKTALRSHYKAGGYTLCSGVCLEYRSVAGVVEVPQCASGRVTTRDHLFGIFIDGATNATAANNTFNAAKAELLRTPIRSGLATWASCSP